MINIKTASQIKIMIEGGKILAEIINNLTKRTKVGVNTLEIDCLAEKLISQKKAKPSFKGYRGYKYSTCISINNEIVHGIPGRHTVANGDIISIDCGIYYKGLHTDSAVTFGINEIPEKTKKIIEVTKDSLYEAIKLIKPGVKLGTIQAKIQEIAENSNYGIVKDLSGHGIGKNLQEDPQIPNLGKVNTGLILKPGMTFCLEPMFALGSGEIKVLSDGWTVSTLDNSLSAHFEHTIGVINNGYIILTQYGS